MHTLHQQRAICQIEKKRLKRQRFFQVLQYPKHKKRKVDPSLTTPSLYPCALIPGQFQEYYHRLVPGLLF